MRAALFHASHDGYMNDGLDDQDDSAGRVSLLLEPTDELSILVTADYFDQGGGGPSSTPIALDPDNRYGISSAQTDAFLATQRNSLAARGFNPIPRTQHLDNQYWGVSATVEWLTDLGTFTLLPAYRETHLNTVGTGLGVTVHTDEDDRQTSIEARLASDLSRRFNYIVGAYYFDEVNDIPLFVPNTQYTMAVQKYDTGVESAAAFGQLRYELTESTACHAGHALHTRRQVLRRVVRELAALLRPRPEELPRRCEVSRHAIDTGGDFRTASSRPYPSPIHSTARSRGFRLLADDTVSFSNWTWRAALDWDVTTRNFLYASYETGFKSGGFFFSSDSKVFQPEHLKAYTLGSKNRLLDDRLQVDVEAFHWRYDDQQISAITQDSPRRYQPRHSECRGRHHEWRRGRDRLVGD